MDPQMQERLMTYAGFIPGSIALVLLLCAWYFHAFQASRTDLDELLEEEEDEAPRPVSGGPRWLLPILLAVGVAGADYAINDTFHLWPDSNTNRFTHAILLIALMGVAEGLVKLPLFVAFSMRLLAYAGAFWMLAEGYVETQFGTTGNLIGFTLVATLGPPRSQARMARCIHVVDDRRRDHAGVLCQWVCNRRNAPRGGHLCIGVGNDRWIGFLVIHDYTRRHINRYWVHHDHVRWRLRPS
jgi:hypothetical protein